MNAHKSCNWLAVLVALTMAFTLTLAFTPALAKPPKDKPGGDGGGDAAAYLIIELPSLIPNEGVLTQAISDVALDGSVYVVGNANGSRACIWTIDADGSVFAEDLGDVLYGNGLDVNSAGIVAGRPPDDFAPVLLLPNGDLVNLPGGSSPNVRINNPDGIGVFQAVSDDLLWDVAADGTVLGTTVLVDATGTHFFATDINDSGVMAGFEMQGTTAVQAVAAFVGAELVITTLVNPNPSVITGFADMEISGGGDVLGEGSEPAETEWGGVYPRSVIWLADGGTVDLGAELNVRHADGTGIATVNGSVQCTGKYYTRDLIAFVYAGGSYLDLQPASEGVRNWLEIDHAGGINSSGIICARGKVGKRRDYELLGCMLIPVAP